MFSLFCGLTKCFTVVWKTVTINSIFKVCKEVFAEAFQFSWKVEDSLKLLASVLEGEGLFIVVSNKGTSLVRAGMGGSNFL